MANCWRCAATDQRSSARAGWLLTRDGLQLPTPLFQPVASAGSLRTLDWRDLRILGFSHVLMNTYHLVVRPGAQEIAKAGGLKSFTGWSGSVLTDSGGYQTHSLAARRSLKPDGIQFTDHLSGARWHFTPSFVLQAQLEFNVDYAMCLDVCTSQPATRKRTIRDLELTHAWARQQAQQWQELVVAHASTSSVRKSHPYLFGIAQGGMYEDLRRQSIETISGLGFDGTAIGGLAVGEAREDFKRLTAICGPILPHTKIRYLMGVGEPADILFAIAQGFDLFDCVQPTRLARHGVAYTRHGRLALRQTRFSLDFRPLDPGCRCHVCQTHSRAYLRHLFTLKEHSYARLLTWHNLAFYRDLLARARKRIMAGTYAQWWPRFCQEIDQEVPVGN